jgi:hypothetical protein
VAAADPEGARGGTREREVGGREGPIDLWPAGVPILDQFLDTDRAVPVWRPRTKNEPVPGPTMSLRRDCGE